VEIISYNLANQKIKDNIYDFVMDIKINDLHWKADAPELLRIQETYLTDKGNFWIATEDGKIVGTTGLQDMGNNQGYLKRMYVRKDFRGTGLTQKLLETFLKHAKENNFKQIFLATGNGAERAVAFYKKSGFQRIPSLPSNFSHFDDPYMFVLDIS
jgi:N-acetylglutamate synthase-like GNAT family acetyltransferase